MNGAPTEPGSARNGPTPEDLDSVLGRFQEWAKVKEGAPVPRFGNGSVRSKGQRKANPVSSTREPSYEQALRASSYRRLTYPAPVEPRPREAISMPQASEATAFAAPSPPMATEAPGAGTPKTAVSSTAAARSKTTTAEAVGAPRISRASQAPAAVGADAAPFPGRKRQPAQRKESKPRAATERGGRPAKLKTEKAGPAPGVVPVSANGAVPPRNTAPLLEVQSQKTHLTPPAFREVFEETARFAGEGAAVAVPEGKTVALSLRVSDVEQLQIQAGAARANLSVSAYLRQCALGVEELRGQVELALGELQKGELKKAELKAPPPPGLRAIPGILSRFASHCFQRLRGRHDYTGISLR